jgi:hypothetical protein
LPKLYPLGFSPEMTMDETDYGVSSGIKGMVGDWNWDLSTTYGKDKAEMGVTNSGNISLYTDTGATPFTFHAGDFTATQWTTNLDVSREFAVGWSSPLNVAMGLEYRKDGYKINPGDAASRYKEGSQSYPGFGRIGDVEPQRHHARQGHCRRVARAGIHFAGAAGEGLAGEFEAEAAVGAGDEGDGIIEFHVLLLG